ncbi:MAG: OmpH family outer membrane protein [Bacteroidales bacterium]|jgi:outer membrane protein|nr:OmpH family outer membrane protein [Bacteroidales bacterium]HOL98883.1 OmpH family outer membrane protein [Bacteroidales bacterium]HPD24724.1 OmpH family outer membrane protein [Bacteroidales bacterium]HRT00469.1 OmpH family outer membrane protein [Bacteroidales bacterium]HRT80943.1 OmpH family outer membrane protein [Bacteroidales bacterium]
MKKLLGIILISVLSICGFAQKGKFGHVDVSAILSNMPEKTTASKQLEDYAKTLEAQLQNLNKELEAKYNDYMANVDTYGKAIKQMKEEEIVGLQQRIQAFQSTAQEDLQAKEAELLEPIYSSIKNAIKQVGEEKGLIYVFDVSSLLYYSSESIDVTNDVKAKLGIK